MYAVKNNQIVLEGTRNPYNQLWDILVEKNTITPCNINNLTKHTGIYTLYQKRQRLQPRTQHIPTTAQSKLKNTNLFQSMEGIFDL